MALVFPLVGPISAARAQTYAPVWEHSCFKKTGFFGGAACRVGGSDRCTLRTTCPLEMGWEGNVVAMVFRTLDYVDAGVISGSPGHVLRFTVPFEGFGTPRKARVKVVAGLLKHACQPAPRLGIYCRKRKIHVVERNLAISRPGTYEVFVPPGTFDVGKNMIGFIGKNIRPIGFGQTPPNFQIDYAALIALGKLPITLEGESGEGGGETRPRSLASGGTTLWLRPGEGREYTFYLAEAPTRLTVRYSNNNCCGPSEVVTLSTLTGSARSFYGFEHTRDTGDWNVFDTVSIGVSTSGDSGAGLVRLGLGFATQYDGLGGTFVGDGCGLEVDTITLE